MYFRRLMNYLTVVLMAQIIKESYAATIDPNENLEQSNISPNPAFEISQALETDLTCPNPNMKITTTTAALSAEPNVLFIMVDDGGEDNYRSTGYKHPIFRWAEQNAVRFKRFSVDMPVCAPSRATIWTSRTSARLGHITFDSDELTVMKNAGARTMAGEFADVGYETTARGKSLHPNRVPVMNALKEFTVDAISNTDGANAECKYRHIACVKEPTLDTRTKNECVGLIRKYATTNKKFFLTCGFNRPHLPFTTTAANFKQASNQMPIEYTKIAVTADFIRQQQLEKDMPLPIRVPQLNNVTVALNPHNYFLSDLDFSVPIKGSNGQKWALVSTLTGGFANKRIDFGLLVKYQRASMSTTFDYAFDLIKEVSAVGLGDKTIIVMMGDHASGYNQNNLDQLGNPVEGFFSKNRLYPQISDIDVIFYVPGVTNLNPGVTSAPGEAADIFPTLTSLALRRAPKSSSLPIDGKDLSKWIKNPAASFAGMNRISQYPRGPLWQKQNDALMAGDQCKPNVPSSGRAEWCNMDFKITQTISGKDYQLYVMFPFYEVRDCKNAGPGNLFEPGEKYWQIMPGSCTDFKAPSNMMLISDDPNELGKNLLFGAPNVTNQKIANDLLKTLIARRTYEGCGQIPQRASTSRCFYRLT